MTHAQKPPAVIGLQSTPVQGRSDLIQETSVLKASEPTPTSMLELSIKGVYHQEDKGLGERFEWKGGSHDFPQPDQ